MATIFQRSTTNNAFHVPNRCVGQRNTPLRAFFFFFFFSTLYLKGAFFSLQIFTASPTRFLFLQFGSWLLWWPLERLWFEQESAWECLASPGEKRLIHAEAWASGLKLILFLAVLTTQTTRKSLLFWVVAKKTEEKKNFGTLLYILFSWVNLTKERQSKETITKGPYLKTRTFLSRCFRFHGELRVSFSFSFACSCSFGCLFSRFFKSVESSMFLRGGWFWMPFLSA